MSVKWNQIEGKKIKLADSIAIKKKKVKNEEKALVFNFSTGFAAILNGSGGAILEQINGKKKPEDILDALAKKFPKKKKNEIKKDLEKFFCELEHERVVKFE